MKLMYDITYYIPQIRNGELIGCLLRLTKPIYALESRKEPSSSATGAIKENFDNAENGRHYSLYYYEE